MRRQDAALGGRRVHVIDDEGHAQRDTGREQRALAVARLEHIKIDPQVGGEEALLVEGGLASSLQADEDDSFHINPVSR